MNELVRRTLVMAALFSLQACRCEEPASDAASAVCGNGVREGAEGCDAMDLGGRTCPSLGFAGGDLACSDTCALETGGCVAVGCGNGLLDDGEDCDGADLAGASCVGLGHTTGTLACSTACAYDESACLDAPETPLPRAPANGSEFGSVHAPGSLRPEFRWEPGVPASAGVEYELELAPDPTFAGATTVLNGAATAYQPAADLAVSLTPPVGARWYWHVRACAGGLCSPYSDAWRVDLGRDNHDFNGDGWADVAISATYEAADDHGVVYVYFTADGGLPAAGGGGVIVGTGPNERLGSALAAPGDLNGDGFADLAMSARLDASFISTDGAVRVFFGGAGATFDTTPDVTVTRSAPEPSFGYDIAGAGDVDDDGYDDLLISAADSPSPMGFMWGVGAAYLYLGGPAGLASSLPALELYAEGSTHFGHSVSSAGDVNGDGHVDVVIGSRTSMPGTGRDSLLYLGGPGGPDSTSDADLYPGPGGEGYGIVIGPGDLDGDEFADIVAGGEIGSGGYAWVYRGGPGDTFDTAVDATLTGPPSTLYGAPLAALHDVNGDGHPDVGVGSTWNGVEVYFGGAGAFDTVLDGFIEPQDLDMLGNTLSSAGDVNGDAYPDLLAGASSAMPSGTPAYPLGAAYLYYGAPGAAFDPAPDFTFLGQEPGSGYAYAVAVSP